MIFPPDDKDLFRPTVSLSEALGLTLDCIEENGARRRPVVPTGIRGIDCHLGGLPQGEVTVLSATQESNGTSLILRMSVNVSKTTSRPVLYVATRESVVSLTERLIGEHARLTPLRLDRGWLRQDEWTKVGRAVEHLSEIPLHFFDGPTPSLDQIVLAVARLEQRQCLSMVVVDSISDVRGWSDARLETQSAIINGLASLARTSDVPVVAIRMNLEDWPRSSRTLQWQSTQAVTDQTEKDGVSAMSDTRLLAQLFNYVRPLMTAGWVEIERAADWEQDLDASVIVTLKRGRNLLDVELFDSGWLQVFAHDVDYEPVEDEPAQPILVLESPGDRLLIEYENRGWLK